MHEISELRQMVMTTDELLGRGISSQSLSRSVASGELVRLRPGFYVEGTAKELPREYRHLLAVLAADAWQIGLVGTAGPASWYRHSGDPEPARV